MRRAAGRAWKLGSECRPWSLRSGCRRFVLRGGRRGVHGNFALSFNVSPEPYYDEQNKGKTSKDGHDAMAQMVGATCKGGAYCLLTVSVCLPIACLPVGVHCMVRRALATPLGAMSNIHTYIHAYIYTNIYTFNKHADIQMGTCLC